MMRIAKLFRIPALPGYLALQSVDGPVYVFHNSPVRNVTEYDLKPLPGHAGDCFDGDEAGPLIYKMYGLVKVNPRNAEGKTCKFYHATTPEHMRGIQMDGYIRCFGGVFLCKNPMDACKFIIVRNYRNVSVIEVELPEDAVQESHDHSEALFGCKAYVYMGNIGIYGTEPVTEYEFDFDKDFDEGEEGY